MTPPPVSGVADLTAPLAEVLSDALRTGHLSALHGGRPTDRRDRLLALLQIYDLHTAPLDVLGEAARYQGHPVIADLKSRLEHTWLGELEEAWETQEPEQDPTTPEGALTSLRGIAVHQRLPLAYRWLADTADWEQVVAFLALEGGPDGGFDDLVAICQVGLSGSAKVELGKNYWDEMGQGDPEGVHTVLHDRLVDAVAMPQIARSTLPVEALERAALGGLLATNRWLQPEMLGALGLIELQAGPRCRMVLKAFDRLGAPRDAYPFYEEHADVDPIHGRDWLEKAIAPIVASHPAWGARIVKGAWWRASINLAFFDRLLQDLTPEVVNPAA